MHTQQEHIAVSLSISLALCLWDNKLPVRFDFISVARFVSLYFRVWFACGIRSLQMKNVCSWLNIMAKMPVVCCLLAVGSCRMCINQIKESIKRELYLFVSLWPNGNPFAMLIKQNICPTNRTLNLIIDYSQRPLRLNNICSALAKIFINSPKLSWW